MAEEQKTHTHVLEDGTVVEHSHGEHGHHHLWGRNIVWDHLLQS